VIERPEVLALLARQHWVVGLRQLDALGVSRSAVDRAVRAGALARVHRNVVRLGAVELDLAGRALAVQLAVGRGAFVSGATAGALHGLRGMPHDLVEVTVHEQQRSVLPGDHRIVVTSWIDEARDVQAREDGIRVASPLRMLFGLARRFNQHRFERAAEDVWHRGLVTPDEAGDYLAAIRRSGKTGVLRMDLVPSAAGPERPGGGVRRDDRACRSTHAGAPAPADAAVRRADPPRPGVAGCPAGGRAGALVVARR
jgi:hypothetical protein